MWLDSEKTYRIFENLIVNITKYAMAQTRVYIEMKEFPDKVSISMKNVSATELDFDVNEITDRFVRGDSSRNTEDQDWDLRLQKALLNCSMVRCRLRQRQIFSRLRSCCQAERGTDRQTEV